MVFVVVIKVLIMLPLIFFLVTVRYVLFVLFLLLIIFMLYICLKRFNALSRWTNSLYLYLCNIFFLSFLIKIKRLYLVRPFSILLIFALFIVFFLTYLIRQLAGLSLSILIMPIRLSLVLFVFILLTHNFLFFLHLLLILLHQLALLRVLHQPQILLLEFNGGAVDIWILLVELVTVHQHLVYIPMELWRMLIVIALHILLDRLQVHGL